MSRLIRKDHLREVLLALWASPRGDRHEDYYTALTLVAAAFGLNVDRIPDEPTRRWVIIGGQEAEDL